MDVHLDPTMSLQSWVSLSLTFFSMMMNSAPIVALMHVLPSPSSTVYVPEHTTNSHSIKMEHELWATCAILVEKQIKPLFLTNPCTANCFATDYKKLLYLSTFWIHLHSSLWYFVFVCTTRCGNGLSGLQDRVMDASIRGQLIVGLDEAVISQKVETCWTSAILTRYS